MCTRQLSAQPDKFLYDCSRSLLCNIDPKSCLCVWWEVQDSSCLLLCYDANILRGLCITMSFLHVPKTSFLTIFSFFYVDWFHHRSSNVPQFKALHRCRSSDEFSYLPCQCRWPRGCCPRCSCRRRMASHLWHWCGYRSGRLQAVRS